MPINGSGSGGQGGQGFIRKGTRGWTKNQWDIYNQRLDRPIRLGKHAISRRRLATLVDATPGHIGMIWSGRRFPSLKLAAKIAQVFEITIDELFDELNKLVDSPEGLL